jgi:predicted amidophosphoribosyltransferase
MADNISMVITAVTLTKHQWTCPQCHWTTWTELRNPEPLCCQLCGEELKPHEVDVTYDLASGKTIPTPYEGEDYHDD